MNNGAGINLSWILTGISLGLDSISQPFLLFTLLIWLISAVYAHYYMVNDSARKRFFLFYLASMAGNIGLIFALDMVSFYLFFNLMIFAAYGLVIHEGTPSSHYAGKIYIIMAVIGEALLISAMILIASDADSASFSDVSFAVSISRHRNLIVALILAGFGVKAGAVPLHMWLPLAYPAAPTPASAVLSGAIVKAGLLGWIRFLPLGEVPLPDYGALCIMIGMLSAFGGVLAGLAQDNPKTVLAYSSISQMGIITAGLGVGLASPGLMPMVISIFLIFSLHHALNKSALFLGAGVAARSGSIKSRTLAGIFLLASSLGLAGAPFTSGAVVKSALKTLSTEYKGPLSALLQWSLPLTSVATTILMGRFLYVALIRKTADETSKSATGLWFPWLILIACAGVSGWFLPFAELIDPVRESHSVDNILSNLWPILAGTIVFWSVWWMNQRSFIKLGLKIPPGDLLELIVAALLAIKSLWKNYIIKPFEIWRAYYSAMSGLHGGSSISSAVIWAENTLSRWTAAGLVFLLLIVVFFVLI